MRSASITTTALFLSLGGSAVAGAQWSDASRVGVAHEQPLALGTQPRASREAADVAPTIIEHHMSDARVGALVGAAIGATAAILAYKRCADASPQSDKEACAVILVVVTPAAIGGGALIGALLGRMHAGAEH